MNYVQVKFKRLKLVFASVATPYLKLITVYKRSATVLLNDFSSIEYDFDFKIIPLDINDESFYNK